MIKKILFTLFFVTTITTLAYGSDCAYVNDQATKVMAKNQITGMAIAIINQDKVEFCNYGYANKNDKVPITEKSIFEIFFI
jgi:CubicO group peptidase (beta-lactamase class C family)